MNGVQPLKQEDVLQLGKLQPKDWNDIRSEIAQHFGQRYYIPVKYMWDDELIGVAQMIVNANSAWLGNVIVRKDSRGQGIAADMIGNLMRMAIRERALQSVYLIASDKGVKVYQKMGFTEFGVFADFQRDREVYVEDTTDESDPHFRPLDHDEFDQILELDQQASGENREILLRDHFEECEVYSRLKDGDSTIDAFYMPTIGEGLIVARDREGGQKLLERHILDNNMVTLPAENMAAADLLIENGFSISKRSFVMQYGEPKSWQPEMIYSRISDYVG